MRGEHVRKRPDICGAQGYMLGLGRDLVHSKALDKGAAAAGPPGGRLSAIATQGEITALASKPAQ